MTMPRLTSARVHKLKRLLDMMYRIPEIAAELGITPDTIYRTYIPAGMPCTQDEKKHYWVNGKAFYEWAMRFVTTRDRKPKKPMKPGQAYCMRCNKVITITRPAEGPVNARGVAKIRGRCQVCGAKVSRFISSKGEAA